MKLRRQKSTYLDRPISISAHDLCIYFLILNLCSPTMVRFMNVRDNSRYRSPAKWHDGSYLGRRAIKFWNSKKNSNLAEEVVTLFRWWNNVTCSRCSRKIKILEWKFWFVPIYSEESHSFQNLFNLLFKIKLLINSINLSDE